MSSSLGDSAPHTPLIDDAGPAGQADCHLSAKVDIRGGRIGLLSNIRSNSSITLVERRGKS